MDCNICKSEIENYIAGQLPEETMILMKQHLEKCAECSEILRIITVTEKIISEEKSIESNPYLSARVMAIIESGDQKKGYAVPEKSLRGMLRPVVISFAIMGAVILGIKIGKLAPTSNYANQVPDEISYLNDIEIESLGYYLTE
jgi:predicted anti-sigma-YlaC factor YlaD